MLLTSIKRANPWFLSLGELQRLVDRTQTQHLIPRQPAGSDRLLAEHLPRGKLVFIHPSVEVGIRVLHQAIDDGHEWHVQAPIDVGQSKHSSSTDLQSNDERRRVQ
jgi:hypothetical protein